RLAEALGHLPAEKTIAALNFLVKDEHPQVCEAARLSLQKLANV
ncbi:MAG: HEAT repeat domain-containing protein, partial [Microcystis sp.]